MSPRPSAFCEWRGIAFAFALLQMRIPSVAQIVPVAIHRFDEPYLLLTSPWLDLLFTRDRALRILPRFKIDQPTVIPRVCHTFDRFCLVFKDALAKVAGEPHVKVPRRIRQDVNPEPVFALMLHS